MQSPSTTAKFLKVTHVLFIKSGFLEGKKVTMSCNTIFWWRLCFPRYVLMDWMGKEWNFKEREVNCFIDINKTSCREDFQIGEADLHYVKTLLNKFGILCYLCSQAFSSHKARHMRTKVSQPPGSEVAMWLVQSSEMWVEMGVTCKL